MMEYVLAGIVSFLVTMLLIPKYIKKAKAVGMTGKDMYKPFDSQVAEMGGLTIAAGFIAGVYLMLYFYPAFSTQIFAAASAALLVTIIGIYDDIFKCSWRTKAILPMLAAPPLIAIKAGITEMWIPFVGPVAFGAVYTFVLIPLALTGAANAANMIAGYNGLEAGLGLIMSAALSVIAYLTGKTVVLMISIPLFFALLGFLWYNWSPAKIFPGDTGTYLIGVLIAVIAILGDVELIGVILFLPHFVNLVMYYYGYFKRGAKVTRSERFGSVTKEGYLRVPNRYYLPWYVASLSKKMTEKKATLYLLAIEAIIAVSAVALVYFQFNLP